MGERRKYAISQFENNVDFIPEFVEGEMEIPFIRPAAYVEAEYIPFNMAGSQWYKREEKGIHFFIHDYQFQRLWTHREKYAEMLKEFRVVLSPDFSIYIDWPVMVQRWNHYRKHLLGAWMQSIGCRVYPTVNWGDKSSYKWCFDGEPWRSTVCVSSVGRYKDPEQRRIFVHGYDCMLEMLNPETIIFNGTIPKECRGNIVPMNAFTKRFKEMRKNDEG